MLEAHCNEARESGSFDPHDEGASPEGESDNNGSDDGYEGYDDHGADESDAADPAELDWQ